VTGGRGKTFAPRRADAQSLQALQGHAAPGPGNRAEASENPAPEIRPAVSPRSSIAPLAPTPSRRYARFGRIQTSRIDGGRGMSIETARGFFLWCSVINYPLLVLWFLLAVFWRDGLYRLWSRWFRLTPEQFDALNVGGIWLSKILILLFNVVPLI